VPSETPPKPPSFTCPRCGTVSYHPKDVIYGYCGACHDFTRMQIVDYLDIETSQLGFRRREDWPELRKSMEEISEIIRQSGAIVMLHGHNLFRSVHGYEPPADHRFSLAEIDELCKRYLEMHKDKKEKP
jgi:hypothetical protein